jgi:hypothetical protein
MLEDRSKMVGFFLDSLREKRNISELDRKEFIDLWDNAESLLKKEQDLAIDIVATDFSGGSLKFFSKVMGLSIGATMVIIALAFAIRNGNIAFTTDFTVDIPNMKLDGGVGIKADIPEDSFRRDIDEMKDPVVIEKLDDGPDNTRTIRRTPKGPQQ